MAPSIARMRRYHGFMADSARWERFQLRARRRDHHHAVQVRHDVDATDSRHAAAPYDELPPIGTISPWLDMQIRTEDEIFGLLEAQTAGASSRHTRPSTDCRPIPTVTYIAVIRHPLDVALSDRDHMTPTCSRLREPRHCARRRRASTSRPIERENRPMTRPSSCAGSSTTTSSRRAAARTASRTIASRWTYWDARNEPNVHLFHYADMWNDLDAEMRRVAAALGVE